MKFSNIIIDDTLNSLLIDDGIFKASVAGLYKFSLFLSLDISDGYEFEIAIQVNGEIMQRFSKNSDETGIMRLETFAFDFELILNENDLLRQFYTSVNLEMKILNFVKMVIKLESLLTVRSKSSLKNYGNCKTANLQHTCSFITGALVEQRYP